MTEFRLWAPQRSRAALRLQGQAPVLMHAAGHGWFELKMHCGAGAAYRYQFDDGLCVPDPASRAQQDDVHGPSLVVDPLAYEWQYPEWLGRPWHEAVVYELHVGACGGFNGVGERLPELKQLGISAVELMPIADFPGRHNWGYDGVLPYAPDRAYGSPEDLKRMIDRAHGLGLMVLLDVVYNHFGPDGNYLHAYAEDFFRDDIETPWGAAIDFRRPEVRQYFTQNALYWLQEYRLDGLRFDAVHAIAEPSFLDDLAVQVRGAVEPGRQVHLILENEGNDASHLERSAGKGFDAQWNDDGHNALHVLLTGESEGYYANYADAPADKLARCLQEGFVYQGEASPTHGGAPRGTPSGHLPPSAFVLFLQNHDQIGNRAFGERLSTLTRPDALRAAVALQLLSPQIPLIFMGEEWGSRRPFLFFTDHGPELADAVRNGRRQEFAHFAAFAVEQRRESIPDPNDAASFLASIPDHGERRHALHRDWEDYYRALLTLRAEVLVPRLPGARGLDSAALGRSAVMAQWRLGDGSVLALYANLGDSTVQCPPPRGHLMYAPDGSAMAALTQGRLPAYTSCAYLQAYLQEDPLQDVSENAV